MKLNFTLVRPGGAKVDLTAQLDATATVGDLAAHLAATDPSPPAVRLDGDGAGRLTLRASDASGRVFAPDRLVAECELASGISMSLARSTELYSESATGKRAATLRVLAGPDKGKEYALRPGSSMIGRERDCEVALTDPLVSRRHARLNVSDTVEVIDQGSSNGVIVGGATMPRTSLRSSDVVTVGNTEFIVTLHHATPASSGQSSVEFVRSPLIQATYQGRTFEPPSPPERTKPQRFPVIALLAPLLMGAMLYALTRSPTSLIFVALSPVMLVGSAVESRRAARKDFANAVAEFDSDLTQFSDGVRTGLAEEASARCAEHPSGSDCLAAVQRLAPLLWARRPGDDEFATVRLALGSLPSRSSIDLPRRNKAPQALIERLADAVATVGTVDAVPVVGSFAASAIGVAGPRSLLLPAARSYLMQSAALHSPSELVIAGMFGAEGVSDWEWVKWLPHTASAHSPLTVRHLSSQQTTIATLTSDLERVLDERGSADAKDVPLPRVLLLVESHAPLDHSRVVRLAEDGPAQGIYVLWLAPDRQVLPAACRTFVDLDAPGGPCVGFAASGDEVAPVVVDGLAADACASAARRLAPVNDAGARVVDASDLPRAVSQFALLGADLGSRPEAVLERWLENSSVVTGPYAPDPLPRRAGTLRAVLGQAVEGAHALDLRADGPHALVGGTTGSGKSELLQSWILSLAAAHSPERVTFLLVDYKGGSAFAECVSLPHTIGLVTDLGPHEVQRALTSLGAELRYREELLAEHGAKDLVELEAQGAAVAPPSLIIVIDEFAALVKEVPEFVDGVVNVAQRGRSLGLHLILATQRPAGVIKDNLRANTNLRVALRMADGADSIDVLGTDAAAAFDPTVPGRAMSKAGPRHLVPFQTAFAGGWTSAAREEPEIAVQELDLAAGQVWERRDVDEAPHPKDRNQKDIRRLVRSVQTAHGIAGLPVPRKAWLPMLAPVYDLARLPTRRTDSLLVFGLADDPEHQAQPTIGFEPDREGSLVVYGTGGSGKSTLLRSFAVAAGYTIHGGPCHVYGLDFGARGLAMLETLPHVGSVIAGSDHERLARLLSWLRELIDERAMRYSQANAGSITDYRRIAGAPKEARILLLVDGIAAFRQAYDTADRMRWIDALTAIASEGRPVGVHVILSSETRAGMTTSLSSMVQRRIVLRMATEDDYSMLGVPANALTSTSPPGRALVSNQEVQIAVLGGDTDAVAQAAAIRDFGEAMRRAGVEEAPGINRLPTVVRLERLGPPSADRVMVGMESDRLIPVDIDARACFLVTGPPASGRSTALGVLTASARSSLPAAEMHYFGPRRSVLAGAAGWRTVNTTLEEVTTTAARLAAELPMRGAHSPRVVIVVEAAGDYVSSPADPALQQLAKACIAEDQWFVAEGEVSTVKTGIGFLGVVKSSRRGLALQPDQETGVALFNTPFPRINRNDFPPGRGLLVGSGRAALVQVAITGGPGG